MSDSTQKKTGKYDDLCEALVRHTQARSCVLLVRDGNRGTGMSFSYVDDNDRQQRLLVHAEQLEFIAAEMRRQAGDILVN